VPALEGTLGEPRPWAFCDTARRRDCEHIADSVRLRGTHYLRIGRRPQLHRRQEFTVTGQSLGEIVGEHRRSLGESDAPGDGCPCDDEEPEYGHHVK
jgi:hypothetical protein